MKRKARSSLTMGALVVIVLFGVLGASVITSAQPPTPTATVTLPTPAPSPT